MNYLIRTVPAIIFVLLAYLSSAQLPDWVDLSKRELQFNRDEYIVGFASEENINNENHRDIFQRLKKLAKADLIENTLVTVRSEMRSFAQQQNNVFNEKHYSTISSEAQMDIHGIKFETHHDINSDMFYALAYVKRDDVFNHYSNRITNLLHEAGDLIRRANQSIEAHYLSDASKTLNEANTKLVEARKENLLLLAVKSSQPQATNQWLIEISDLQEKADKQYRRIYGRKDNTLSNVVYYLVRDLQNSASDISGPLLLKRFTYEDTQQASSFSARLDAELAAELANTPKYSVIRQKAESESYYIIEGNYWDGKEAITIILYVLDKSKNIKASSKYFLSTNWLEENNVDYVPDLPVEATAHKESSGQDIESKGDYGSIEIKTEFAGTAENILHTGRLYDTRDGKTYRTVKIGRQTWMAENLAYKVTNGNYWAYQHEQSNVAVFGYLYDWQTANRACPSGWKLPGDADWNELVDYVGSNPGKKLKAKGHWRHGSGAGTDEFGFTALPGGYRNPNGSFDFILNNGYWWSSTEKSAKNAWMRAMYYDNTLFNKSDFDKADGFSVRCVKIN